MPPIIRALAPLYAEVLRKKAKPAKLAAKLFQEWLWGGDCTAPGKEGCGDMNYMHMLGLLLCLMESFAWKDEVCVSALLPSVPLVHLYSKPIASLTLRELTTQLECLQLSWGNILSHCEWDNIAEVLRRLMARLGLISHHAFPEGDPIIDDPQYTAPIPGKALNITTRKYIRQMMCILLLLFRWHSSCSLPAHTEKGSGPGASSSTPNLPQSWRRRRRSASLP
jgi:hypothetical protein